MNIFSFETNPFVTSRNAPFVTTVIDFCVTFHCCIHWQSAGERALLMSRKNDDMVTISALNFAHTKTRECIREQIMKASENCFTLGHKLEKCE